jgi:hypothetical protein
MLGIKLPSIPTTTSRAARPARSAGPPGVTFSMSAPPSTPSSAAVPPSMSLPSIPSQTWMKRPLAIS